jgi:hypothetical protein
MNSLKHRDATLNQTEIDHQELDSTEIERATAKFFSWAFVTLLFAVPLSQFALEASRGRIPGALDLFKPFVDGIRQAGRSQWTRALAAWQNGIRPETLHGYEAALENDSILKNFFQPRVQEVLTGRLGAGNEKVILGRGGWVFFQHGLEYVVHQSVIDPSTLELAAKKMVDKGLETSPHPDPRPVFLQLNRDCRNAGIHLIVMPIPDKVMLQPMQLYAGYRGLARVPVPNNEGYARLMEQMKRAGVDWFDPTPATVGPREVRYLRQDTHWTPEFMDAMAAALAGHIRQTAGLAAVPPESLRMVEERVSRLGDLVDMLKMTKSQTVFTPQQVTIQRIVEADSGRQVEPDPASEVLLLGDSFTNIYSLPEMGWGSGAGFGEYLAYHLQRRIDVIALNGGGASRTRMELARQDNAARLGRKKVIVYEFAMRDLLAENWKPLPMVTPVAQLPVPASPPTKASVARQQPAAKSQQAAPAETETTMERQTPALASAHNLVVVGRIVQTSRVPAPETAPYKDCLTFVKVKVETVESGEYQNADMIVVFWAMKDNRWLAAASYAVGDRLRMTLIPFSQADPQIRNMQRADDTDDFTLRPFYSTSEAKL